MERRPGDGLGFDGGHPSGGPRRGLLTTTLDRLGLELREDEPLVPGGARPVLASGPVPPHGPPSPAVVAAADPSTAASLAAMRRRAWWPVLGLLALTVAAGLVAAGSAAVGIPRTVTEPLAGVAWLAGFACFVVLAVHPVRQSAWARSRRTAQSAHWELAEVVAIDGHPTDRQRRAVVVLDGTGRPFDTWLAPDRGRGLPPLDRRTWAYLAVEPSGRHAVVAPVDRSRVVRLDRGSRLSSVERIVAWAPEEVIRRWDLPAPSAAPVAVPRALPMGRVAPTAPKRARRPLRPAERVVIMLGLALLAAVAARSDHADQVAGRRARAVTVATGHRSRAVISQCRCDGGEQAVRVRLTDGLAAGWDVPTEVGGPNALRLGSPVAVAYTDPDDLGDLVVLSAPAPTPDEGLAPMLAAVTVIAAISLGWGHLRATRFTGPTAVSTRLRRAQYFALARQAPITPADEPWLRPLLDRPSTRWRLMARPLVMAPAVVVLYGLEGWSVVTIVYGMATALMAGALWFRLIPRQLEDDRRRLDGEVVPERHLRLGRR